MKKTLGQRISELRRAKGLKQDELAESLGVSAQAVSKWENDITCPDIMNLPSLAKLLGVTVDALLSGEEASETHYIPPETRKKSDDMMLKIKVIDGKGKVNVNLPIPLIRILLESNFSLDRYVGNKSVGKIDLSKIMELVEAGVIGKLVEVDGENDEHVEIVVE